MVQGRLLIVNLLFLGMAVSAYSAGFVRVVGQNVIPNPVAVDKQYLVRFTLEEQDGAPVTFDWIKCAMMGTGSDGILFYLEKEMRNFTIGARQTWTYEGDGWTVGQLHTPGNYRAVLWGKVGASVFWFQTSGSGRNPVAFSVVSAPPRITIATNPVGREIIVDGTRYNSPQSFTSWSSGSHHTIAVVSPQAEGSETRHVFSSWGDGGAQSHIVTIPGNDATYTANFETQYYLATQVSLSAGGTIYPPSPGGWYGKGIQVEIRATPASGYEFLGWSGGRPETSDNITRLTMDSPKILVAKFGLQNRPPVAVSQQVITDENSSKGITLTGQDPEGDNLVFAVIAGPAHGTVRPDRGTLLSSGAWVSYEPERNFSGQDRFIFTVDDGHGHPASATVEITVKRVNHPPVLNPIGEQRVREGSKLEITLSASDSDGDEVTYKVSGNPPGSRLVGHVFSWTPSFDAVASPYTGITFTADDTKGGTDSEAISIIVEDAPQSALNLLADISTGGPMLPGSEFEIEVKATGASNLLGISFILNYPSNMLDMVSRSRDTFPGSESDVVYYDDSSTPGMVQMAVARKIDRGGVNGGGTIARVRFRIVGSLGISIPFSISDVTAFDARRVPISVSAEGAALYYLSTSVEPDEGGTVSPAPPGGWYKRGMSALVRATANSEYEFGQWEGAAPNALGRLTIDGAKSITARFSRLPELPPIQTFSAGDVDGNGEVNAEDARLVLGFSAGLGSLTDRQRQAADFDGDGKINSKDALLILRSGKH